jgi:uncharacterized membrane protein
MNPFDLKAALLAKHAQHVVLIHFPIALFLMGVIFDVLGRWRKVASLLAAAYYNFLAAALSTVPVIATGLLAWQFQLEGRRMKGILLQHLILGSVTSAMIWLVWYLHLRARRRMGMSPALSTLSVELIAAVLVALTGHLGGFLSGVNGPG